MCALTDYGGDLRAKENSSLNEAINTFLDIIVESKEPGVFQKFITALKTNGKLVCSFNRQLINQIYGYSYYIELVWDNMYVYYK